MKPLTKEQFDSLKVGDVLRWYRPDGTYILRTIIDRGEKGISFPIRRKSWTRRIHTTYCFYDAARRCELHQTALPTLMTDGELLTLCERGFDIPKQLQRERHEHGGALKHADPSKLAGASMLAKHYCPSA